MKNSTTLSKILHKIIHETLLHNIISVFCVITIMIMLNPLLKLPFHYRANLFRMISHRNKIFSLYAIQNALVFSHNIGNTWFQEDVDYISLQTSKLLIENTSWIISNFLKLLTKHIYRFYNFIYLILQNSYIMEKIHMAENIRCYC